MYPIHRIPIQVLLMIALAGLSSRAGAVDITWNGAGDYRILARVPAVDLDGRPHDEMVASLDLKWTELLAGAGIHGGVDLSTLQVQRVDPDRGEALRFTTFTGARSPFDRPCRYEDHSLSEDYPGRVGRASNQQDGRPPVTIRRRKARLFNLEKDNDAGRLVWVHTQDGDRASYYAIYFDICPEGKSCVVSPSPWIGDVDVLRREQGEALGGFAHFTATTGDVNGDGLFDIVAGTEKGDVFWFPNRGSKAKPLFLGCRMMMDQEGPIDTGWYAAPFFFDWNDDGKLDLLVGTSGNVILWWANEGTRRNPSYRYRGFVQADGGRLEVPESPVPEDTNAIFNHDYYNQPWVGDLNGDGLPDILTGGYTTGRIFHYRGVGRHADGTPVLTYVGPITADNAPLDTTWAAAPYAADVDDDGKPELFTGSWWWSGIPREPEPGQVDYLMYYTLSSVSDRLEFSRRPMPIDGPFPRGNIARPTVADWNDDGLPDLMVSDASGSLYTFLNVGTRTAPKWKSDLHGLTIPWGFAHGFGLASGAADVDGDGQLETVTANRFTRITGSAYSPKMKTAGLAKVQGKPIRHPGPGYGDPYAYTALCDWDQDGRQDLLWGTHQGRVYLHLNAGASDPFAFKPGIRLRLSTGEDLRVGPPVVDHPEEATDFTILQGSRIILDTVDFDGDGIQDLIVAETFGNIWVFLNMKTGGTDTLQPGVKVNTMPSRTDALTSIDWNADGKPDLMTGGTAAQPGCVYFNESTIGHPALGKATHPLNLPYVFWGPEIRGVDWNQDGDRDFLIQSEFLSFWAEGSFLKYGYRPAVLLEGPQRRGSAAGYRSKPDR